MSLRRDRQVQRLVRQRQRTVAITPARCGPTACSYPGALEISPQVPSLTQSAILNLHYRLACAPSRLKRMAEKMASAIAASVKPSR